MQKCDAYTRKGKKCKNYLLTCPFHSKIYHSYSKKEIEKYSDINCGYDRESLFQYGSTTYIRDLCDVLPIGNVVSIFGPISFNEWELDGKRYAIFGEVHNIKGDFKLNKKNTLTFPSFLESLSTQNAHKIYDIFIERPHTKPTYEDVRYHGNTILHIFDSIFINCLVKNKIHCEFKNLRIHTTDYRKQYGIYTKSFMSAYSEILSISRDKIPEHDTIITIFNMIDANDYESHYKKVRGIIQEDKKIHKQLKYMKNEIIDFIFSEMETDRENYYKFVEETNVVGIIPTTGMRCNIIKFGTIYRLVSYFIKIYSNIMDIYLLGRLFKYQSKRNIIYVENIHAMTYCKFFEYMTSRKIISLGVNEYNIDLSTTPIIDLLNSKPIIHFSKDDRLKSFLFK